MPRDQVQIRPVLDADRAAVARFVEAGWGGLVQVAHGTVFRPAELPGFLAELAGQQAGGELAGLLTYVVADGVLEIVTLNAVRRLAGTGTALLDHAVAEAGRRGCREIRLTTTNDNVGALRFYQRRGFRLAAAARRGGRGEAADQAADPAGRRPRHSAA